MAAMSAPIPPLGMKELRRWRGVTGQQIAIKIGIARCNAFAWQQRDVRHLHIETLRKYVEAMGGELRLVAVFGDGMARPALRAGRRPLMRTVGARQRGPALRVPALGVDRGHPVGHCLLKPDYAHAASSMSGRR
jgi:hypothetical protein